MSLNKIPHLIKDSGTQIRNIIDHSIEYLRLEIAEKIVIVGGSLLTSVILLFFGFSFFLLLSIGVSMYLGEILASYSLGFVIVATFYLLIGLVVFANRKKWILDQFLKGVIDQMDKDEDLVEGDKK